MPPHTSYRTFSRPYCSWLRPAVSALGVSMPRGTGGDGPVCTARASGREESRIRLSSRPEVRPPGPDLQKTLALTLTAALCGALPSGPSGARSPLRPVTYIGLRAVSGAGTGGSSGSVGRLSPPPAVSQSAPCSQSVRPLQSVSQSVAVTVGGRPAGSRQAPVPRRPAHTLY